VEHSALRAYLLTRYLSPSSLRRMQHAERAGQLDAGIAICVQHLTHHQLLGIVGKQAEFMISSKSAASRSSTEP
jgi:hypothetical protein